jgi:hypothetical protein
MDKQRQRQAMVPDVKISLTMGVVTSPVLHELKVIRSNQTRYKPSWKERGVYKRSSLLHDEYVGKAKKADQQHCGTPQDQIGRVEAKLLSFPKVEGIVFGNWG